MTRDAMSSKRSHLLAVILLFYCISATYCQDLVPAVTNSRTTVLDTYGESGTVRDTLLKGDLLWISCRIQDAYIFDDPWWLNVTVGKDGNTGWVADYFTDCGYIGFCQAPECQ